MPLPEDEMNSLIVTLLKEIAFYSVTSSHENLLDNGALNSITLVELALALEKKCSVQIPFLEINRANFTSIDTIKNLILSCQ
ncbi:MAG: hypothetical protein JST67_11900 [Bacteroidetes bacterium]|nr:hypothetical protein [Bacteroidota bacterium]